MSDRFKEKHKTIRIKRYFPFLKTVQQYSWNTLLQDLPAGVMVAILLVPQAIAYAYLAGMPPQYGLYAAIVPIIIYSLLGTSPHLAIGPVAISALLVLAGVCKLQEPFCAAYTELVIFAGLMIGIVQFLLGLIKVGKYVNLLSYPVITGFTSAASLIIITSQVKDVLGIQVTQFDFLPQKVFYILSSIAETHYLTFIIAVVSFILLISIKNISRKIPSGLLVVSIGIFLSYYLDLESKGVDIIGFVPSGLPSPGLPMISLSEVISLIPTVLLVSLIGVIECVGIAKAIENKNSHYELNTNQELIAVGISKIGGAFFGALPSSGSFSRSALLHETKARTTVASLITVFFVVLALLFLTPTLYYLPKVILSVIIIYAVKNLFEYNIARKLFKIHRFDFAIMLLTFFVTLLVSIEIGVAFGFLASFFTLHSSKSSKAKELRKIFSQKYKDEISFDERSETDTSETLTIQNNLHFGNVHFLKETIKTKLAADESINELNIQIKGDLDIDSSSIKAIEEVQNLLQSKEIQHSISGRDSKLLQRLKKSQVRNLKIKI